MKGYVQDGGGPKDSENTLNSFLTKTNRTVFWQIGTDMKVMKAFESVWKHLKVIEIVYNFCNSNLAEACINDCSAHAYKLPSIYADHSLWDSEHKPWNKEQ